MHISGRFTKKANIDKKLCNLSSKLSNATMSHIYTLYSKYSNVEYFTRIDVEHLTKLKQTRAYELIKLLLQANIIEPVKGHGKGKYRFI